MECHQNTHLKSLLESKKLPMGLAVVPHEKNSNILIK
jgi:hypothetical protein